MPAPDTALQNRHSLARLLRQSVCAIVVMSFVILLAALTVEALSNDGLENGDYEPPNAEVTSGTISPQTTKRKKRTYKRRAKSRNANSNRNTAATTKNVNRIAVIDTDAGLIKIELLRDEAPQTVENFVQLARRGYYNGIIFHRVISGFMIQGGDPTGTGRGGETATGQPLPNEVNPDSPLYQGGYKRGAIAMANKGRPESGSSQFFIMHQNYPLPPNYTIFGRVIEGIETVDKIATAPTSSQYGEKSRPANPVKIKSVTIQ